ncbi:hypothetical protein [Natrialba sp. SSL1]|uniref:hypothetical protein n=1 Tax=Natrialba sp. SSL1 TaxID=1869245 RepID=UPI0008F886D2|nr:hypothetical protein [Natrialba sp. SSL1]OIB57560.1 hypothetical protein BBD46_12215 [Natrialba sp. SSL1]
MQEQERGGAQIGPLAQPMTTHIKLHGSKAERFEQVKAELSERMGYELSNPEVLGLLMAGLDLETLPAERRPKR